MMREPAPLDAMLDAWRSYAELGFAMTSAYARIWTAALQPAGDVTVNFPFGQGFTMNIAPATSWDFGRTSAPDLEREILDRAGSYGLQLGRIMDLVARMAPLTGVEGRALEDFKELKSRVDEIKQQHGRAVVKMAE